MDLYIYMEVMKTAGKKWKNLCPEERSGLFSGLLTNDNAQRKMEELLTGRKKWWMEVNMCKTSEYKMNY